MAANAVCVNTEWIGCYAAYIRFMAITQSSCPCWLVGWSFTSLFSTKTAISETTCPCLQCFDAVGWAAGSASVL